MPSSGLLGHKACSWYMDLHDQTPMYVKGMKQLKHLLLEAFAKIKCKIQVLIFTTLFCSKDTNVR